MKKWNIGIVIASVTIGLCGCGAATQTTDTADVAEQEPVHVADTESENTERDTEQTTKDAEQEEETPEETPEVHVYDALIQEMYEAVAARSEDLLDIDGLTGVHEATRSMSAREALQNIGYHIEDLNGDQLPELVVGAIAERQNNVSYGSGIYAVYTYDGQSPKCLLDAFSRDCYDWMGDARFLNTGSGGAMYHINAIYELMPRDTELSCVDFYFTHEKDNDYEDIRVYYNATGEWDVIVSQEQEMSLDEFWEFAAQRSEQTQSMELTPFWEYEKAKIWDKMDFLPGEKASDYSCAVAYLGYRDVDETSVIQELEKDGLVEQYPFLADIPAEHMVVTEGREWYVIVPTEEDVSLRVGEVILDEKEGTLKAGGQYLQVNDSQPILLRANESDIVPNLMVTLEMPDGREATYSPCLSMRDGSLQVDEGVFDFTPYQLLPSYAFCMYTNPNTPEYEYYQVKAYSTAPLEVDRENGVPVLFMPLKDAMELKLEQVEWSADGEIVVKDVLEQRTVGTDQGIIIWTQLYADYPELRVTVTYTENGEEKCAEWYAYGTDDTCGKEYVCW